MDGGVDTESGIDEGGSGVPEWELMKVSPTQSQQDE